MFKLLNRRASTPVAITIVVILAIIVIGGIFAYQYYLSLKEKVKLPQIEPPKDEIAEWPIKFLDTRIIDSVYNFIEGGPSPCQWNNPDSFDPKINKLAEDAPETHTRIRIDPDIIQPYGLTVYEFWCLPHSQDFILDLTKNGERQVLYTHVLNWGSSNNGKFIYLVNSVKNSGKWELKKRIINIETKEEFSLPNLNCISMEWEGNSWRWGDNKLITFSEINAMEGLPTEICVWDESGSLLFRLTAPLDWCVSDKWNLTDPLGILPEDKDTFYFYSGKPEYKTIKPPVKITVPRGIGGADIEAYTGGEFETNCVLYLQDLKNQNRKRRIVIIPKVTKIFGGSCLICPPIEVDNFKGFNFNSSSLKYRIKTQIDSDDWSDWQIAQ